MLQPLEPRRMFSVTASFAGGVLTVMSDHAADQVLIGTDNHGQVFVHAAHHVILAVPAHHVTSIQVGLGAGDDALETQASVHAPMNIHGGLGNDTLRGGSGHDMIFGDDGNDLIYADDGVVDDVDGGAGIDTAVVDHHDSVHNVEHIHHHGGHHHFAGKLAARTIMFA
jgi:Ca2+-binding RTX toxin-like protein